MIIQGTNNPIIFIFPKVISDIKDIEISLYTAKKELKHWTLTDVTIEGKTIQAPLTQEETVTFPIGQCFIEVKWINENGKTEFAGILENEIISRKDHTIMEGAQ